MADTRISRDHSSTPAWHSSAPEGLTNVRQGLAPGRRGRNAESAAPARRLLFSAVVFACGVNLAALELPHIVPLTRADLLLAATALLSSGTVLAVGELWRRDPRRRQT